MKERKMYQKYNESVEIDVNRARSVIKIPFSLSRSKEKRNLNWILNGIFEKKLAFNKIRARSVIKISLFLSRSKEIWISKKKKKLAFNKNSSGRRASGRPCFLLLDGGGTLNHGDGCDSRSRRGERIEAELEVLGYSRSARLDRHFLPRPRREPSSHSPLPESK